MNVIRVKRRRFPGVSRKFTKPTPTKVVVTAPTARSTPAPKKEKKERARYSCAESIVTTKGNRVEVVTVPAAENRKATARCYTPAVWTPAMEESCPELSNVAKPNPAPVAQVDDCGLPITPEGKIDFTRLNWSSLPVETDDDEYDPELDPDNI